MADETYEVEASLELDAPAAVRSLKQVSDRIGALGARLQSTRNVASGLLFRLIAIGGAYLGVRALTNAFTRMTRSIFSANTGAEAMQTALATVYSAVERVSFARAQKESAALFQTLEDIAVVSPATGAELFGIFQGIYGPIRATGAGMKDILKLTQNSASAATALGIDFGQAQRDISLMARGLAGTDVKTFSLLTSLGLITETTEKWNKMAPDKRAKRLMEVMGKMGGEAAEAYARTWVGLSSTFRGIMEQFRRVFGAAAFERMKATLERTNNFLLKYRAGINAVMSMLGARLGAMFDRSIMGVESFFASGTAGVDAVAARFDAMVARMSELWARFQELKPLLVKAAKVFVAIQLAQAVLGPLLSAVGLLGNVIGALGGLALVGKLGKSAGKEAGKAAGKEAGKAAGKAASKAAGAVAGKAAAGAAAAGGAAAAPAGTLGTIMSVISSIGTSLTSLLLPLVAVGVVIAAVVLAFREYGAGLTEFAEPLIESLKGIWQQLKQVGEALWSFAAPILAFVGGAVIAVLIAAFRMIAWVLNTLVMPVAVALAKVFGWVGDKILKPIFKNLAAIFGNLYEAIKKVIEFVRDSTDKAAKWGILGPGAKIAADIKERIAKAQAEKNATDAAQRAAKAAGIDAEAPGPATSLLKDIRNAFVAGENAPKAGEGSGTTPNARSPVTMDMRGSKIEIKQEFREANPDRVWVQTRDAFEREAVSRTQSSFAGALGR